MTKILAADIGGTNSRFAHFGVDGYGRLVLRRTCWLDTAGSGSFAGLLGKLREQGALGLGPGEADAAVIAVAGPVERGSYSSPPFIPWDIDMAEAQALGFKDAVLINDFVAQAYACRSPVGEAAAMVLEGEADPGGTAAVIGGGTGLGKAALAPDGRGGFVAVPSEGGHAAFPFVSTEECEFAEFVKRQSPAEDVYVTGNIIVSGRGLGHIHAFLTGERLEPEEVAKTMKGDSETLRWFARFYGRACRDFALEAYASGGLYIAGGVAARNPAIVRHEAFAGEFLSSPRMSGLLRKVPVFLISDQDSGLWGAALLGLQRLRERRRP